MKRNTTRVASLLLAATAVSLGAVTGCSSAPSESVESGHEAFTYDQTATITASAFNTLVTEFVQPGSATFSVSNNEATFTSSQGMTALGFDATIQEQIPVISESAGICETATITVPSLTLASPISITLGATSINIDTTVNGSANAHTSGILCPNPTLNFSNVPVHAALSASGGKLVVSAAQVTLSGHTSPDCGAFGWCDGLVSSYVGDAQNAINKLLLSTLSTQFAKPVVQGDITSTLLGVEELQNGVPNATIVPGSLTIANGVISDTLAHVAAPPVLSCTIADPECTSAWAGESVINCAPASQGGTWNLLLQRQINGVFQTVSTTVLSTPGFPTTLVDPYAPSSANTSYTYRVCSSDSGGTACGAAMTTWAITNCGCSPYSCGSAGLQCGTASNGCGGTMNCGGCATGDVCSSNMCCPTGLVWNATQNRCAKSATGGCTTPACQCAAAGGAWDGKTCE